MGNYIAAQQKEPGNGRKRTGKAKTTGLHIHKNKKHLNPFLYFIQKAPTLRRY
jgi:hypothetical protein